MSLTAIVVLSFSNRAEENAVSNDKNYSYPSLVPRRRNAVFTLIKGGTSLENFAPYMRRCKSVIENLNETDFEDIAFHEGNIPNFIESELKQRYGVRFENVHDFGGFSSPVQSMIRGPSEYHIGYKHMCRFFSVQWMHVMKFYEYVIRIDEDVLVYNKIRPFVFMETTEGVEYAFALQTTEKHKETLKTFSVWMDIYTMRHKIARRYDAKQMYFTNIFLTRVSFWLREDVQLFLKEIDSTNNIYKHRWGDAPIQTAALHLFAPTAVKFIRIDYSHGSTMNEIVNGKDTGMYMDSSRPRPEKNVFDNFYHLFQKCVAPCLVANAFQLRDEAFTKSNEAISAIQGDFMLRTDLPIEFVSEYDTYQLCLAYQLDVRRKQFPLPPDTKNSLERIAQIEKALQIPPDSNDTHKLKVVEAHPCCRMRTSFKLSAGNLLNLKRLFQKPQKKTEL